MSYFEIDKSLPEIPEFEKDPQLESVLGMSALKGLSAKRLLRDRSLIDKTETPYRIPEALWTQAKIYLQRKITWIDTRVNQIIDHYELVNLGLDWSRAFNLDFPGREFNEAFKPLAFDEICPPGIDWQHVYFRVMTEVFQKRQTERAVEAEIHQIHQLQVEIARRVFSTQSWPEQEAEDLIYDGLTKFLNDVGKKLKNARLTLINILDPNARRGLSKRIHSVTGAAMDQINFILREYIPDLEDLFRAESGWAYLTKNPQ